MEVLESERGVTSTSLVTVAVHHDEASGYHTTSIPKPAVDHLGKGKNIDTLTYTIKGSKVEVNSRVKSDE